MGEASIRGSQREIAKCLGVARHAVRVSVRRIGGGFGGKESASTLTAVPVALAAARYRSPGGAESEFNRVRLRRPVRMQLERDVDMALTGGRHPFRFDYKVR